MILKKIILPAMISLVTISVSAQTTINLYEGLIPNSKTSDVAEKTDVGADGITRVSGVTEPQLIAFFPEKVKNTGKAVVIFPGGGYSILAIDHEGYEVAKRFNEVGISAFVVKYRLPNDKTMDNKSIGPLQDAQRAIQLVRTHAEEWGIDKNKVGIAGFSAGGHLASTLGTHYQVSLIDNADEINLRPDFMLLMYPVISMDSTITHRGSRQNLLGKSPSEQDVENFSNERQVNNNTPPSFLVHAKDDKVVPINNSERFRDSLVKHQVPVDLLIYEKGGHGFGLNNKTTTDQWFDHFIVWLKKRIN